MNMKNTMVLKLTDPRIIIEKRFGVYWGERAEVTKPPAHKYTFIRNGLPVYEIDCDYESFKTNDVFNNLVKEALDSNLTSSFVIEANEPQFTKCGMTEGFINYIESNPLLLGVYLGVYMLTQKQCTTTHIHSSIGDLYQHQRGLIADGCWDTSDFMRDKNCKDIRSFLRELKGFYSDPYYRPGGLLQPTDIAIMLPRGVTNYWEIKKVMNSIGYSRFNDLTSHSNSLSHPIGYVVLECHLDRIIKL